MKGFFAEWRITPFTSDMSASGDGIVADCGVIDQWYEARIRGFPADEDSEDDEVEPDPNGIRSVTETEYPTTDDPEELLVPDPTIIGITLLSEKVKEEFDLVIR
ncbi:hypothetical protein QQ045_002465 [Rhodiola kirilowii]